MDDKLQNVMKYKGKEIKCNAFEEPLNPMEFFNWIVMKSVNYMRPMM